jgi:hypothetical protein
MAALRRKREALESKIKREELLRLRMLRMARKSYPDDPGIIASAPCSVRRGCGSAWGDSAPPTPPAPVFIPRRRGSSQENLLWLAAGAVAVLLFAR